MSQRFIDSFEHYPVSIILKKWTSASGALAIVTGRNGSGLQMPAGSRIQRTIDYQSEWIVGWAFKISGVPFNFGLGELFTILSNGTSLCQLILNADGTLSVHTNSTFVNTTTLSIHQDTWYYFEYKAIFTDVANVIHVDMEFRVNGNVEASGSSSTGRTTSTTIPQSATGNVIQLGASSVGTVTVDDFYANDVNGGVNNNYNGDVKILAVYPNGDIVSDWSPATPHFSRVNEHSPDGDSSYIYSNTANQKDIFDWEDLASFSGTVKGVQYLIYARKDAEGSRAILHNVGNTGTENEGTTRYLGDDYLYHINNYDLDPNGSIPWTVANFNSKRFGVKLVS